MDNQKLHFEGQENYKLVTDTIRNAKVYETSNNKFSLSQGDKQVYGHI